ncbi:MAG TPA: NUDIX domain-containing protein [Candidatus Saccharimonadales bacterium]|nr:NUDIX domain-containing protein [Candidatus Saccharimonadales bacterium]
MSAEKNSVSLVIKNEQDDFLVVKRQDDPTDELAGAWGFPAATLKGDETAHHACQRIGKTKLGVELQIGKFIGASSEQKPDYMLHLSDYEATILSGDPKVPQLDRSVSQYDECKFTNDPTILFEAARRGSLCTRIFLKSLEVNWQD